MQNIRIGIVGLGKNTRLRHVPGFRRCENVELIGVCNRSAETTEKASTEFNIPKRFAGWQDLVADPEIDAVMIGTWPYLHCPITIAALENNKHVLTEARMARDLHEASRMGEAAQRHPHLVTQIVPSPFGLQIDETVKQLLEEKIAGEIREITVHATTADFANPQAELHWRQSRELSGNNMLTLGIIHETLIRWFPDPINITAKASTFVTERNGKKVERPDTVHVLTELPNGIRCLYHISGAIYHGPGFQITIYGSKGTIQCQLGQNEKVCVGTDSEENLTEFAIPTEKRGSWRVEADFIDGIRNKDNPKFTDFASGIRYMRFTDGVEQSITSGETISF